MIRVFVENLEFLGRHGVYPEERAEGRVFRVDLAAELTEWTTRDAIESTLDYRGLAEIVLGVAEEESVQLLETLGRRIVGRLFERYAEVARVTLSIRKRATEVPGDPEWVGASFDVGREQWEARERDI